MSRTLVQQFVAGLKSRNPDVRNKTARDLHRYVRTELREVTVDEVTAFTDAFNHHIFEMVSSNDVNEKKSGIIAIVCLLHVDVGNVNSRNIRFANYLRNLLPSNDIGVMRYAAKTVGKLAQLSDTFSPEYAVFEMRKAIEWLGGDRVEGKRHAAVLVLKELAVTVPTIFYQHVQSFFDFVFSAVRDPKPDIRQHAVKAIRAALVVTAQRESAKQSQKPQWYRLCFEEAMSGFEEGFPREKGVNREDRVHGSLLVLNELLRVSNVQWERTYEELMTRLQVNTCDDSEDSLGMIAKSRQQVIGMGYKVGRAGSASMSLASLAEMSKTPGGSCADTSLPLYESAACRTLISEKFEEVANTVLAQRMTRPANIQQTLLTILPRLAAFNKDKFVQSYLNPSMIHLLTITSLRGRDKDRPTAFTTIGLIAVAVGDSILPFLPKIFDLIKTSLPSKDSSLKKRSAAGFDSSIFICVTLLGHAVTAKIKSDVYDLLDPMLATGLSPALTITLRELASSIPQLKRHISEGLLKMLSQVLMNRTLRHPGASPSLITSTSSGSTENHDVQSIVLALSTLGSFNFDGHSLLQFVRRCADHFLNSDQQQIRLEAVKTCSKLLRLAIESTVNRPSQTVITTVADVLGKLLVVGITDTVPEVRFWVLASLDESFDQHLAQAENLSALFVAMNDEIFEIRERAVIILGRLSVLNPAYVMPSLRKTLIQFLSELEHSGMGRNKEQSARMLDHLVVSAPRLIKPYVQPILKVLVPKLREPEPYPGVVISILTAIGDLAAVNGTEMCFWIDELLPILLDMLVDSSSSERRGVALWALGQLVEATGYVVKPYNKYPTLLDILMNFLKTEQQNIIRRETIRVLGLLGALDPYKHKMNLGQIDSQIGSTVLLLQTDLRSETDNHELTTNEMLVNMSSSTLEEYYPAIAIATLIKIFRDPSLSNYHTMVVQAIAFIFKSLGSKCVPFIAQVMPSFLNVIRTADTNSNTNLDYLVQQFAFLMDIVKQHIRNYLDDIFVLIKDLWSSNASLQLTLILLIEHIAMALGAEFKIYLPQLMPQILRVLSHDTSQDRKVTVKMLCALQKFGANLDDYMHLVLPPIVRLFDSTDCPIPVCRVAMETIDHLSDTLDFTDFASRIIHPLVRSLDTCSECRHTAMETLCALVLQLGRKYRIFVPLVSRVVAKHKIHHTRYDVLTTRILTESTAASEDEYLLNRHRLSRQKNQDPIIPPSDNPTKKMFNSMVDLRNAWTTESRVSRDDWLEWLKRLSIELLRASSSPALRSCYVLGQTYSQLPRDLFNVSFVSCWTDLNENLQQELLATLEQAIMVPDLPEITQTILNLAEFMDHCDKGPLPLNTTILGERAIQCRAYAKALHYKEEEFLKSPDAGVIEALISINNKLQQKEAANGLLEFVKEGEVQERWYEKLQRWDKALASYEEKLTKDENNEELALGKMRCLEALGEWEQLSNTAHYHWEKLGDSARKRMARTAAAGAWPLSQWEAMARYVSCIPQDSTDGAMYRAVLAVHKDQYALAYKYVDSARDLLDTELTAMVGESYQRAHAAMVQGQMLAELEEVIQYKLIPERRPTIRKMWWERLQGCEQRVEDWQRIIQVHTLVISPHEDMHTWLKYASLCRKAQRYMLSHKTLVMLLGIDPSLHPDNPLPIEHPHVSFAYTKHLWSAGHKELAFKQLQTFVTDAVARAEDGRLLARCYVKLGEWQESLQGIIEESISAVLQYYAAATDHDEAWYKAWHSFAYMNFETVLFYKHQPSPCSTQYISQFTVPAVEGFFKSISLSHGSSLQDTLRLLTLWFDYGQWPEVYEALVEGIFSIEINTWLQVIPQLIARIDTPRALVSRLIHHLLIDIGKRHPQALVYPLTVASKSNSTSRRNAANKILKSMCDLSPLLVQQAVMVSDELIRVAILWHELWHEGLEEASRLYFGERNVKGMFDTLEPLHAMLERGPQTLKETSFHQAYGRDLVEALEWCNRYKISGNVRDLNQAWDLYYHVFRRISRQLPQLTSLELQYVSPKLLACRDLELAVPGSYIPGKDVVRISYINSSLQVITSKQRPRKLCIRGSNGHDYMFLLKGHEDLRQDERVMQLFGLVNTLLLNDPDTFRRNLTIQRYAVIPLSTNSGLIGWVPHCDTLHTLIRDYREKKKILLNIEHRIMLRMAPDYDHLTLMQKVEVFEHALEHTQGDDLARLLWLKSPSSEVWFDRRTNYTRSLAVMSMVGYILGKFTRSCLTSSTTLVCVMLQ
uniref:Serine/threonine-protein kinase TOR n=1 Tax=Cacopsylla melanoneura TaxID=428564 RepID=A0A8D9ABA5_9HEMI